MYAEPAIRIYGKQGRNEITVCHEYADLYVGHSSVHGLAYSGAGEIQETFDKVIYLRDKTEKGVPMDWIFDAAHQLGVTLEHQKPQIMLSSFDFVRTQRFGISRVRRPRIAIAMRPEEPEGWPRDCRRELGRLLCEKMQAGLVYVGGCFGETVEGGKDLREKLMAREIAAVLRQCDLLISEDEEITALASAVQVPAVYLCRKSWDRWPAAEGACVVSVYPEKVQDVLEAIGRLRPAAPETSAVNSTGKQSRKT